MANLLLPTKIVLHCSATRDSGTLSWNAIRRYHTETNGWTDIGYHYGLEYFGGELVLLQGRSPFTMGAHCSAGGRNRDSLGFCVVGKFDERPPDAELYWTTVQALATLSFLWGIAVDDIYGHREFESRKTCPGAQWDLDVMRRDIDALISTNPSVGFFMETAPVFRGIS